MIYVEILLYLGSNEKKNSRKELKKTVARLAEWKQKKNSLKLNVKMLKDGILRNAYLEN